MSGDEGDFWNEVKAKRREYRDGEEPSRLAYAKSQLEAAGHKVVVADNTKLIIFHKGSKIQFYPFTGWHTGKGIKDGRGIKVLLRKLEG